MYLVMEIQKPILRTNRRTQYLVTLRKFIIPHVTHDQSLFGHRIKESKNERLRNNSAK